MNKTNLSKRLGQLAMWIAGDVKIADIGTDHGYLPYYLLERKAITYAICCDINSGPLNNAKSTFADSGYKSRVEFRLGSGIEPIKPGEVDYVVIAGMGGGLIRDILSKNLKKTYTFKGFFLQPQTEQNVLRAWLLEHHFEIVSDFVVTEDQKFYEGLFAVPKNQLQTQTIDEIKTLSNFKVYDITDDMEFGYSIQNEFLSDYVKYLDFKSNKYRMILSRLDNTNSEKIQACKSKLDIIAKLQKSLSSLIKN